MIKDTSGERLPLRGIELFAGELLRGRREFLAPRLIGEFRPRHADDPRALRQTALREQGVQRGNQLAAGEIAGGAENDEGGWHAKIVTCRSSFVSTESKIAATPQPVTLP